jgi:hypothetical protein
MQWIGRAVRLKGGINAALGEALGEALDGHRKP